MTPFEYAEQQSKHPTPPPARTKGSKDWAGWCLVFVCMCFGIGPGAPTALQAWERAKHKHPETNPNKIPRGVPVFWDTGDGHVALSRGGGSCWSTDFLRHGKVNATKIADIGPGWDKRLLGWTEDLNGVQVYKPGQEPVAFPHIDAAGAELRAATTRRKGARAAIKSALATLKPYLGGSR